MFSGIKKRLSKTLNRAGELLTGVGPSPIKQFKNAIIDGDEEKAISLYTATEAEKPLSSELDPSKPFPTTKKTVSPDIPLHLSSKYCLYKLVLLLLENGGDPSIVNVRKESCLHCVCSLGNNPELRAEIMTTLIHWDKNGNDCVSINQVDIEGNTAIHYAASNGLLSCVEKLVSIGAIISIVNKNNNTCCEMADEGGFKVLASMLELALVFQPVDEAMEQFDREQVFPYEKQPGRLILAAHSLTLAGVSRFIEEAITAICETLSCHRSQFSSNSINKNESKWVISRSRAEVLLQKYNWNISKLQMDFVADKVKVLTAARFAEDSNADFELPYKVDANEIDLLSAEPLLPSKAESTAEVSIPIDGFLLDLDIGDINVSIEPEQIILASSSTSSNNPVAQETCAICGEVMLEGAPVLFFIKNTVSNPTSRQLKCQSGHGYCVSCWSSYQNVQVRDNGAGCLQCPAYKCSEIIDYEWAPVLLQSQELVNRLMSQRQRSILDCSGLKSCTTESCGLCLHLPTLTSSEVNDDKSLAHGIPCCAVCNNGHGFCISCSLQSHSPCTCSQMQQWLQQVNEETKSVGSETSGDDLANALWVAANTKRCPRCNTPIEKDEGCNHMSCRKCRKEFCWICMQDWSLHSDNTGGYFQCNKFVENAKEMNNGEDANNSDGNVVDFLWAEEKGNAHAETIRLRERGKKMARFIHYYTRYQAHGESVKLETKMKKDTVDRITLGLKESAATYNLSPSTSSPSSSSFSSPIKSSSESTKMIWLQGKSVINPLLETSQKQPAVSSSSSNLKAAADSIDSASDDLLSKFYVTSEPCLQFLVDGFDELLKCRIFLQWSYPYSFFEFIDAEENADISSRQSKRNRWARTRYQQDHRLSFELLQSDLEAMVETLSDVVARRRLRASRNQIALATRAAKSKRIELEYLLITYAITKQSVGNEDTMLSDYASNYSRSSTQRRGPWGNMQSRSGLPHNSAFVNHWSNHQAPRTPNILEMASLREGDFVDEEDDELAAWLFTQELSQQQQQNSEEQTPQRQLDILRLNDLFQTLGGTAMVENNQDTSHDSTEAVADSTEPVQGHVIPSQRRQASTGKLRRRKSRTPSSARSHRNNDSNSSNNSSNNNNVIPEGDAADIARQIEEAFERYTNEMNPNQSINDEDINADDGDEWEDIVDESSNNNTIPNNMNAVLLTPPPPPPATTTSSTGRSSTNRSHHHSSTRISRRAEEYSALNRAILLSLQDSASGDGTIPASNSGLEDAAAALPTEPSAADIDVLTSMGFTSEQAVQALRESRGNVQLAANRLLEAI
mmetsp:Transcript_32887/g.47510  ORF Transcript_32887/g.47510 Transcript_32887/m.47510 type:complete len:1304 (-) Transcript_32887:148-4059(-)